MGGIMSNNFDDIKKKYEFWKEQYNIASERLDEAEEELTDACYHCSLKEETDYYSGDSLNKAYTVHSYYCTLCDTKVYEYVEPHN
jgi:hypothetical protein